MIVETDLDRNLYNVLAGILGASLETKARVGWQITERYGPHILNISPEAIEAAHSLLPQDTNVRQIDVNTLLPLVAAFRLAAGESPTDVALAVTRLALRHPLGIAQDNAAAITLNERAVVARLFAALQVAEVALKKTWDMVGTDGDQARVRRNLNKALVVTNLWSCNQAQFSALKHSLNCLYEAYHALPDRPLRLPVSLENPG